MASLGTQQSTKQIRATAQAQGYRTPLPALKRCDTSTIDGMQSADYTMVATDSTHPSTNTTDFLELLQGVRITTSIQSSRNVTASPQSTISWSQGQSSLHFKLAT